MEETTKEKRASGHGPSLEQTARRFKRWREGRKRGEHIPQVLWAAAVGLAQAHGVQRIAHELHLDLDRLNRRVQRGAGALASGNADMQFVEMFAPTVLAAQGVHECVLELENARGAKMRVELAGSGLAALAGLCSAFWGA